MNVSPHALIRHLGWYTGAAVLLAAAGSAGANTKPPPPPPHAAPARPPNGGGRPGGGQMGAHMPGNMGGGAHVPGGMQGGAHVPGGGGRMPGGGGAPPGVHLPSNMQHAQRPEAAGAGARTERQAGAPRGYETRTSSGRAAAPSGARHDVATRNDPRVGGHPKERAGLHGGGGDHARAAGDARIRPARADPRMQGTRLIHTAGITGDHVQRAGPRSFLRRDDHRDAARDRAFVGLHDHDFHTRRVADFDRHEFARWRGGLWRNEWHYGRRGWWWDVDGVWYGYPAPIWPYPIEVAPFVVYDAPFIDGPDMSVAELVPVDDVVAVPVQADAQVIAPLPATPVGWYRCDQPGGYYPGIGSCGTYWALVQNAPMPGE